MNASSDLSAQRLADRLTRVQQLVSVLSRALTVEEVARAVVTTAAAELQFDAALVALLTPQGDGFEITANVGYMPHTTEQWRTFPLDAPLPAGDAIRRREMVVLQSLEERDEQYPILRGAPATHETNVIVPLIAEDRPLGIIALAFNDARPVLPDEREFMRSVSEQCAAALHRAQLYEKQQAAAELQAFLARASRRLARSLAVGDVAEELADIVVPDFADACAVHLAERAGLRLIGLAHRDPEAEKALRALTRERRYSTNPWLQSVAASKEATVLDLTGVQWAEFGADAEQLRVLELIDLTTAVMVPLQARGRTVGIMTLVMSGTDRRLTERDVPGAADLGAYAALALDNALLFEQRSQIAETLQLSLLPPALPAVPGLDLGASYRAAGSGAEVGGDFYDVFQVSEDRWVVVLGDVRGRGTQAAAITGVARHTIRAVAFGDATPDAMVRHLNRALLDWQRDHEEIDPRFCAVNIVVIQPSTGAALLCCAGNPLPLVVAADGTVREVGVPGTVAGVVEEPGITQIAVTLEPGDLLIGHTDGITERGGNGRYFDDGLLAVLGGLAGCPAQAAADGVRQAAEDFADDPPTDDMAVVAVRFLGQGTPPAAVVEAGPGLR